MNTQNEFCHFEPAIMLNKYCLSWWIKNGMSMSQVKNHMDELGTSARKATGYPYMNHVYVKNLFGVPVLKLLFGEDGIHVWSVRGYSLGKIAAFDDESEQEFTEMVENVSEGLTKCFKCSRWVKQGHQSGPAFVCHECYNPNKHLPPDPN